MISLIDEINKINDLNSYNLILYDFDKLKPFDNKEIEINSKKYNIFSIKSEEYDMSDPFQPTHILSGDTLKQAYDDFNNDFKNVKEILCFVLGYTQGKYYKTKEFKNFLVLRIKNILCLNDL
ncbi:12245_t:CDS:1, partial [Cetraspora pellucida]